MAADSRESAFSRAIASKAARKLKIQRSGRSGVWYGLGMAGSVGWSVVVPTVLGALLGAWLDKHHPGTHSWTLALLVAGLVLGCASAWRWVTRESRESRELPDDAGPGDA